MTVRYYLRYLCDGYTLADAFRPQPNWGAKCYTVDGDQLGAHTDINLIEAAKRSAPAGYWLNRIETFGGPDHGRVVFKKAVTVTLNRAPLPAAPAQEG